MSYQVLYRAWRPQTFSEIVGQDEIVRTLRRQVVTGRVAHAYLFCGTRGTGKTTASKVLARAVNCLNPRDGDPCGECEICRAILEDRCMDVSEIDAASNNGVDEIRDLREKVQYPPSTARYKVYIIDEVHMLSPGAFNALLKTLEEPPAHAVFILATTEPHRLPATILSRVQRFDFRRIGIPTIVGRLKTVLQGIGREAEEDALTEIARAAEGAMRDALSLLDGCLSYTDGRVTVQLAREVLGTTSRAFLFDFADALLHFDAGRALRMIQETLEQGSDPRVFAAEVTAHLRGLLLAKAVGDVSALLEITPEDADRFREQAQAPSVEQLTRLCDLFMRTEADMKLASHPRTALELTAVRCCHPEQEADAALSERMARMEQLIESGAAARPRPAKAAQASESRPAPAKQPQAAAPAVAPPEEYLEGIRRIGEEIPSIKRFLECLEFSGVNGDFVDCVVEKKNLMALRTLAMKQKELDALMSEAMGRGVVLRMRERTQAAAAPAGLSRNTREAIDQATELFGRENLSVIDASERGHD